MPKACICGFIFIALHFFMYTHSIRLHTYITEMNQMNDSIKTFGLFGKIDFTDCICMVIFSVYAFHCTKSAVSAFMVFQKRYLESQTEKNYNLYNLLFADTDLSNSSNTDLTVNRFAPILQCMVSLMLLGLLFMPPQDEMLQFMDESGLINVYLIVLSFLISPVEELELFRFEGQMEAMRL